MHKLSKVQVDYINSDPKGTYFCKDCIHADVTVCCCEEMRPGDLIKTIGGCIKWKAGTPSVSHSQMKFEGHTPQELKYEEHQHGFGCKRCHHFDREDYLCERVSEKGGPDPGAIMPKSCCNDWEYDRLFSIL